MLSYISQFSLISGMDTNMWGLLPINIGYVAHIFSVFGSTLDRIDSERIDSDGIDLCLDTTIK